MAILAFLRCLLVFLCCIASSSDAKTVLLHPEWPIDRPWGQKELAAGLFSPERPNVRRWGQQEQAADEYSPVFVRPQDGLRQADKIVKLPGQPRRVDFNQYSGYVTVDPKAGRELFYYFAESPRNSSTNPLVLWLNGGPGCSSFGYGAMMELGPFRVNADGKTLFRNHYSWTEVANVIFLESPVGVGFSYSNTSTEVGDRITAKDAYSFLLNWLERFPQYKNRDFFIAGESYAGHYVPQLAYTILRQNENKNYTTINLRGIAIGNPLIDDRTFIAGRVDYLWSHASISDETHRGIHAYCDFANGNISSKCSSFVEKAIFELGDIDLYNIYAPVCLNPSLKNASTDPVHKVDPCSARYIRSYLNTPEVQTALHAKSTNWSSCSDLNWTDSAITILPIIQDLVAHRTRVWIFSGDLDAVAPFTSTKYALNGLKLPIVSAWRPWYSNEEVGGYVVGYKGVALVTVRGAGHMVPTDQPMRSLTMISSFLQGHLPPRSAPF